MSSEHTELLVAQEALLDEYNGCWLSSLVDKPPPAWLFDGFLRDNSITMVNAEPYSGKTMLLLAIAICAEYDLPLFNRFRPVYPHHTFFIGGGDSPDWDYGGIARKLMLGMGLSRTQMAEANIPILPNEGPKLTDQHFITWINKYYEVDPFDLLIIDTLLSVHDGDENSARDMKNVMAIIKMFRSKGVAVVFGHHDAKMQEGKSGIYRPRGSSVISGSVDFMFSLSNRSGTVHMGTNKARGVGLMAEPFSQFTITETLINEQQALTLNIAEDLAEKSVRESLATGPKTRNELSIPLSESLRMTPASAYRKVDAILRNLKQLKLVRTKQRGVWELCLLEP